MYYKIAQSYIAYDVSYRMELHVLSIYSALKVLLLTTWPSHTCARLLASKCALTNLKHGQVCNKRFKVSSGDMFCVIWLAGDHVISNNNYLKTGSSRLLTNNMPQGLCSLRHNDLTMPKIVHIIWDAAYLRKNDTWKEKQLACRIWNCSESMLVLHCTSECVVNQTRKITHTHTYKRTQSLM